MLKKRDLKYWLTFSLWALDLAYNTLSSHPKQLSLSQLVLQSSHELCNNILYSKHILSNCKLFHRTNHFYLISIYSKLYLSANSIGVSDGCNICGSIYQTSHTTAQEAINCIKCIVKDCLHQQVNRVSLWHSTMAQYAARKCW